MTLALIGLTIGSLLELLLWLPVSWRQRKIITWPAIGILEIASIWLLVMHPAVWTVVLFVLSVYRIVNLLRLLFGQTQPDYLLQVARGSSWRLIGMQMIVLGFAAGDYLYDVQALSWLYIAAALQCVAAVVLLCSTFRHLKTTRLPHVSHHYADRDLPTLTVAIPARNETDDLEACLQSLVANTYPKLEILVLDDCSQNKRTPEIIRSFAHDGVRFIAGKVPPEHWVAKNYAYQRLADEANGQILLFCGVDARFEPDSIRLLVEALLQKKKSMLSIIPRNILPKRLSLRPLLVQPGRYAWELALPRRWLNRPPVLSTCWMITADALHAAGGFKAVSRGHSPESYMARTVLRHDDGYSFVQSDAKLGIYSTKSFSEQVATAVRTRYPQLHRRPELTGLLSLIELAVLVGPFGLVIYALVAQHWLLAILSLATCCLLSLFYIRIVSLTYRRFLLRSLGVLPVAALYDIGLLNYSMAKYEFGTVIWKDRNVCIPVMRAIPNLPQLDT